MEHPINDTYEIEYSGSKNAAVPVGFGLSMSAMFFVPAVISVSLLSSLNWRTLYMTALFSLAFSAPTVVAAVLYYFKQRKHFKGIRLRIQGNRVVALDAKTNRSTEFLLDDIHRCESIWYLGTYYTAIRLNISRGRTVSIGNSMTNYERFRKHLERHHNIDRSRRPGGHLENTF